MSLLKAQKHFSHLFAMSKIYRWLTDDIQKMQIDSLQENQMDNTQVVTVNQQAEVSNKRPRKEEGYLAETIIENKFKIIYNKKAIMTTIEEGVIDVDDNNGQQTDDEATMIVNETLREIQNE